MKSMPIAVILAFGSVLAVEENAAAGLFTPHDPNAYPSQGTLSIASGQILTLNTDNSINGIFDYDSISMGPKSAIVAHGSKPLILLSRGDINIATGASIVAVGSGPSPGPGGFAGGSTGFGSGPGGGAPGTRSSLGGGSGGGGGGYGGMGGNGENSGGRPFSFGGSGGQTYIPIPGLGGSGGGAGWPGAQGGGGGGAVEIGATGRITDLGSIYADGGRGDPYFQPTDGGAGGGSGGLVFLHAPLISYAGTISASGGLGGSSLPGFGGAGGRGGGGWVDIMTLPGGLSGVIANISVDGANLGRFGFDLLPATPEPGSIFLLAAGSLCLPILFRFARKGGGRP